MRNTFTSALTIKSGQLSAFPRKKQLTDFRLWKQALCQLVPAGGIHRLGAFQCESYKIWDWQQDVSSQLLFYITAEGTDTYKPSQQARYVNRANRWEKVESQQQIEPTGTACSVKSHLTTIVSIASTVQSVTSSISHSCFLDVLVEWGYTWLWDNLQVVGDENWILQSIQEGSICAVTDGSYLKDLYPDICSAA